MTHNEKIPLSVVIISYNAATALPACLDSVQFAEDIVVIDSGSSDGTVEIARAKGARVIHQDWLGFGPQKQFAVETGRHDWVLCIDADERVSEALQASLRAELRAPKFRAYAMPRCNRFMGRWLRHGEGYPDWSLRLFNKQVARWSDDAVHETVLTTEPVGRLQGDLLHESAEDLDAYLAKQNRYTTLQAQALARHGKSAGTVRLVLSPVARFIKFYLVRAGFMDGIPGLVHITIGCMNSFMKYAKLRELQRRNASA
jgi:glycosyltransferase involved in cell wall biosynthesis